MIINSSARNNPGTSITGSNTSDNLRNIFFEDSPQYSLGKIVGVWALATIPMACLVWVLVPKLLTLTEWEPGIVFWSMVILGMSWQFLLALFLLRQEGQQWTWVALRKRLWLERPRDPVTGMYHHSLYWSILGGILFVAITSDLFADAIDTPFRVLLHIPSAPAYADIRQMIAPRFAGQWILLVLALVSSLFNYVLGEALLFHGVLLPRMIGVFGRWAWLANAIVFGLYHVHMFWTLPSNIISSMAYSWTSQRYRSVWFAVLIHGFEGVVLFAVVSWIVFGGPVAMMNS